MKSSWRHRHRQSPAFTGTSWTAIKTHEHGMLNPNEPYDMNPAGDIDLGSVADIPMCEFWDYRIAGVDAFYNCQPRWLVNPHARCA
ncbi:MAG: hypothetical protein GY732_02090 [Gammaproteobacteria bacterium]|nr:hypothetical protein [Gammaproteobacteria bacterium]